MARRKRDPDNNNAAPKKPAKKPRPRRKITANLVNKAKRKASFYFEDNGSDRTCNVIIEESLLPTDSSQPPAPFEKQWSPSSQNIGIGLLSPKETSMWSSSLGAHYASKCTAPGNFCRKLGTITRTLFWQDRDLAKYFPNGRAVKPAVSFGVGFTPPTKTRAEKEARVEAQQKQYCMDIPKRGQEIMDDWKYTLKRNGILQPNWDVHGEFPSVLYGSKAPKDKASDAPKIVPVRKIRTWFEHNSLSDDPALATVKNLYHLQIPVDTLSVLKAIDALARPDSRLYLYPLVVTMPVLRPLGKNQARLTMHVYAHRLLFECMTTGALRTVMAALDDDNYTIQRPLESPPSQGRIVFGKDPNTKVDMEIGDSYDDEDDDDDVIDFVSGDEIGNRPTRTNDTLDAFSKEGLMNLIENQGVEGVNTVYKTQIEPALYSKSNPAATDSDNENLLRVSLLPHQIHGVCWMYQMEHLGNDEHTTDTNNRSLGLNGLLWERRRFREGDDYYYSPALGQARLTIGSNATTGTQSKSRTRIRQRKCQRGGILADEMGLGKTVQAVALILATLEELKQEAIELNQGEVENDYATSNAEFYQDEERQQHASHATLIIVPPALVGQWMNEIRKIAGSNLMVQFLDHKNHEEIQTLRLDPSADVVLTTYQALEGKSRKNSRKYNPALAASAAVSEVLASTIWGRIILDEMQEVRSWNTVVSQKCQELESDRRWMLSGTPLWEGIEDFKGELCFLGLEPFAANNEDGFFKFAIANHWEAKSHYGLEIIRMLALVMLRRTKSMTILETGMPLLGLKNMTLVFEPVPQNPSERALYCFLESVLHTTMTVSDENDKTGAATLRRTTVFLRLLRELCVSPYLINGGLGCTSQLKELNRLMVDYNRKKLDGSRTSIAFASENNQYYSCDEAIQFLSQVEDNVRTDSDFVTDQRLGGGSGVSRRNRALLMMTPQEKISACKEKVARSNETRRLARSNRARARWQWALEGITTGRLKDRSCYERTSPSLVGLWQWRNTAVAESSETNNISILSFLRRGFRPTPKYFSLSSSTSITGNISERKDEQKPILDSRGRSKAQEQREERLACMYKRRPELRWAYPFAMILSSVPIQISEKELQHCLEHLRDESNKISVEVIRLRRSEDSTTWESMIHFSNAEDFDWFETNAKRVDGIQLEAMQKSIPAIEKVIDSATSKLEEAEAMQVVHPCTQNERNLAKAKAAYEKAKVGLCIFNRENHNEGHIVCSRAFGNLRGVAPKTSDVLYASIARQIDIASAEIAEHTSIIFEEEKTMESMQKKLEIDVVGLAIENLNTFDVLQALKNGDAEKTTCPICYGNLGDGESSREKSDGKVLLTRCGHLSCRSCLNQWILQKEGQGSTISCIECRKPIVTNQLICVDPTKVDKDHCHDRKNRAKNLVQQAAKMLEQNYGQLDPHLWEALYLVIDLPVSVNRNLDGSFTAIPGLFLGHLRHLLGGRVQLNSSPDIPIESRSNANLPSKFRALLADLPRDELSVVFASSKSIVLHLQCVLELKGFQSKALFVGQSEQDSECAISDWESKSDASTVLIVQAGAAACGLTLTKSSKLFIMEPFRKHEQEKQAYARLHRYGQTCAVHCKVYYTPVSVESRLLEWRRRANAHTSQEENTVYAPMRQSNGTIDDDANEDGDELANHENNKGTDENDDNDDDGEDENQTRFLLGLSTSAATSTATTDNYSWEDSDYLQ